MTRTLVVQNLSNWKHEDYIVRIKDNPPAGQQGHVYMQGVDGGLLSENDNMAYLSPGQGVHIGIHESDGKVAVEIAAVAPVQIEPYFNEAGEQVTPSWETFFQNSKGERSAPA